MRAFVVSLLLAAALPPVTPAFSETSGAAEAAPESRRSVADIRRGLGDQTLDQLFATLAKPGDEATGQAVEAEIERRWLKSGSDTIDLLMEWSAQSLASKDYGRALDFLDAVTMLKPDFAEGWNRRATIFYLEDEYGKAIADLEKVLALQPRHFGALAGLGLILRDVDRDIEALAALRKAIEIDPYLDSEVQDAIDELRPSVEGRDI